MAMMMCLYHGPHLGGMVLEELTPAQVQETSDAISRYTPPVGERLSPAAVRERLLPPNSARGCDGAISI